MSPSQVWYSTMPRISMSPDGVRGVKPHRLKQADDLTCQNIVCAKGDGLGKPGVGELRILMIAHRHGCLDQSLPSVHPCGSVQIPAPFQLKANLDLERRPGRYGFRRNDLDIDRLGVCCSGDCCSTRHRGRPPSNGT